MQSLALIALLVTATGCAPVSGSYAKQDAHARLFMQDVNTEARKIRAVVREFRDHSREAVTSAQRQLTLCQQSTSLRAAALQLLNGAPPYDLAHARDLSTTLEQLTTQLLATATQLNRLTQSVLDLRARLNTAVSRFAAIIDASPAAPLSEWSMQHLRDTILETEILVEQASAEHQNLLALQVQAHCIPSENKPVIERLNKIAI